MKLRVAIVSGATSGIGFETAKSLASKNHHVVLLGRTKEKCEQAILQIKNNTPHAQLSYVKADLSDQSEIKRAAQQIREQHHSIDILVNNAGIWMSKRILTVDGFETTFAVNHLAYFLLTHLLYPQISNSEDGRILLIGSDSHFQAKKIPFHDLSLEKNYHGLRSYALSKLANVMMAYEFDQRNPNKKIKINCIQPGLVKTDIGTKHTKWLHKLAWKLRRKPGMTANEAAQYIVPVATSHQYKNVSGKYIDKGNPKPSSKLSMEAQHRKNLWNLSETYCGTTNYFHQ